jgi:formate hydrogenlyase subunit 3/multisubunit Na+/H+ antiporter MnhD subunit
MDFISPIYIIAVSLGIAFFTGLLGKKAQQYSYLLLIGALLFNTIVSLQWIYGFTNNLVEAQQIFTSGFKPPFSINLLMGFNEAVITGLINIVGVLGAIYMASSLKKNGTASQVVFLVFLMSLNVVVFSRDLFNIFVFLEVGSIATAGLIILQKGVKAVSAGFKYMVATGIIAGILLMGIIFIYHFTGSLNIDSIIENNPVFKQGALISSFLIIIAIVLELKPFPANGWALDVYEASNPGIAALISAGSATAIFFVLNKLMVIANEQLYTVIAIAGLVTFVGSNLLGTKQDRARRLLGYSSVGQLGLLMAIIGFKPYLGDKFEFIAITILISHYFAKAGLFWLAGIIKQENLKDWSILRRKPYLLVLFGTFVFVLIGFPPFPSFFGKWELIMHLSQAGQFSAIAFVLIGSFLEGIYLFRWLGYTIKMDNDHLPELKIKWNKIIPVVTFGVLVYGAGYYTSTFMSGLQGLNYLPLLFIVALYFIDFVPAYVKNTIAILGMVFYSYQILPDLYTNDMLRFIFAAIFLVGGILTLIAGYAYKGKRVGFYPVALLMYVGLAMIIQASNTLEFFFGWELMTAGSYFLIIRGKKSMPHGLSYMLFAIAGAYALLAGFGLSFAETSSIDLSALANVSNNITIIFSLLAVGFMTKTASLGLHIWLPGAHAEAESDVSPMVSAILLKAGVFGIMVLMIAMGHNSEASNVAYVLGWIGAITALIGNLAAAFQEDAKRLLAYSSISQLGYILFALAMMSHLGWMTAMVYSINHFLYKAVLFLTIGAVVLKVGTHYMYKMGGLIKNMPMAFIAVLIGIIALSGVPPLSGFAGKWLFYNAVLDKQWYFQGAIVFFSGIIAFLYLFKLIYSVFLGQLKDNLRHVKDISIWFAIPIYTLIIGLMIFSAKPEWVLQPLGSMISEWYPNAALSWDGGLAKAPYGYWDGTGVMITIGILFMSLLAWLLIMSRKATKVNQFNIVYSAEAPQRPETTHMSYNIYAGYNKALGWLVAPKITQFWNTMSDYVHSAAHFVRQLYSGGAQIYATHVVIYIVAIYLIMSL